MDYLMFHWGRGGVSRQTRMGVGSSTLLKGSAPELIFFCQQPGLKPETKSFLKSFQPGPMNIHMANPGLEPVTLALTVRMNHEAPGKKDGEKKRSQRWTDRERLSHMLVVDCDWMSVCECTSRRSGVPQMTVASPVGFFLSIFPLSGWRR